jgi:hypothetical protein
MFARAATSFDLLHTPVQLRNLIGQLQHHERFGADQVPA